MTPNNNTTTFFQKVGLHFSSLQDNINKWTEICASFVLLQDKMLSALGITPPDPLTRSSSLDPAGGSAPDPVIYSRLVLCARHLSPAPTFRRNFTRMTPMRITAT